MQPNTRLVLKITESFCLGLGPAITALNLFSFSLTRGGNIYYKDGNTWGIAIGVLLIFIALISRRWQQQ